MQYVPPSKKQKKKAGTAIEPSLEAPEGSTSAHEAALRLQDMLNFAMQDSESATTDGDAAAAANALAAAAASGPNFSSATQEQLLAALRNINPDLVIHDPRSTPNSPAKGGNTAGANSAPATVARDLPQFTGGREGDLPVPQMANSGDAVIDPTLNVSGEGGKSSLNPTLLTSLGGLSHRDVLSQKWLNTTQLNELSDTQGRSYRCPRAPPERMY